MAKAIQAIRGMNDLLPEQVAYWQRVERVASEVFAAHGYREIRFPILEKTELYKRSIGEVTDIVEKEMYTFEDRNGDSLTLRPEGTAGCVRAGIENGLLYNQVQRLWYAGPMFRHERPQKGRYRQFHQIGAEAFGIATPDLDAEMILMTARLWRALGLPMESVRLEINSLGTPEARHAYREALVRYLASHRASLDEDSLRRLESNPLRVLDSKNPALKEIIQAAPNLLDYLDDESRDHFSRLQAMLGAAGVPCVVNPRLVRGLDYYTRTVFEWITTHLGAQGTICAGGRYDGLVAQLGGHAAPAAGFALGLERLVELLSQGALSLMNATPQIYLALLDETLQNDATVIAERLRDAGFRVLRHCGGGSLKSQMKKADQSGASVAVLLAQDTEAMAIDIKPLREGGGQERVTAETLVAALAKHIH